MIEGIFQSERMRAAGAWLLGVLLFVLFAPHVAASCLAHTGHNARFTHAYPMCQAPVLRAAPVDMDELLRFVTAPETRALAAAVVVLVAVAFSGLAIALKRLPPQVVHRRRFLFWIRSGTQPFTGKTGLFLPYFCPRSEALAC